MAVSCALRLSSRAALLHLFAALLLFLPADVEAAAPRSRHSRRNGVVGIDTGTGTGTFERVLLTDASSSSSGGAVCLDGSPGAYYVRRPVVVGGSGSGSGSGSDGRRNSWLIFHEGGGWCRGDGGCLARSYTDLGSSKNYPPTIEHGGLEANALFSSLPDYTIIYAKYCDGSSWTGNVDQPVTVNAATIASSSSWDDFGEDAVIAVAFSGGGGGDVEGTGDSGATDGLRGGGTIYYRGRRLLDALFHDLLTNRGLSDASHVIYGGCSAGALTAYLHIDYVRTLLPSATKLSGMADAMFSLHYRGFDSSVPNYYTNQMKWGYTAWNASTSINDQCREHYSNSTSDDAWECLHGATAVSFVETPTLIINSKYDTWQQNGVLGLGNDDCKPAVEEDGTVRLCGKSTPAAQAKDKFWRIYGAETVKVLTETVPERHGAFITACPAHCMTGVDQWGDSADSTTNVTLGEAVARWVEFVEGRGNNGDKAGGLRQAKAPRWVAPENAKCFRHKAAVEHKSALSTMARG